MNNLKLRFTIITIITTVALAAIVFMLTESVYLDIRSSLEQAGLLEQTKGTLLEVQSRMRLVTGLVSLIAAAAIVLLFRWFYKTSKGLADITKRGQVHERLAHTGTLASGLVHELRNPLNAVKMNLQLLEEDMEREAEDSPQKRRVARVLSEVDRLDRVLTDFLSYARPRKLERSAGDAARILDETLSLVEAQAQSKGVRVLRDLPDGLPSVLIDADALKQAFLNLVLNGLAAMEGKADATLIVRAAKMGRSIKIEITDTGKGISPENLPKIFDLFFSTKQKGTGLGLAVVKRIIEEHDGTIEVTSEVGRGTSFVIMLPVS